MWSRVCFLFATVLLFGLAACDDTYRAEKEPLVPTHISPFERFLKTILVPVEIVEDTVKGIGKVTDSIVSLIPGLKGPRKTEPKPLPTLADLLNPVKDKIRMIYPGTRWCGDGDIARSEDDLGLFHRTDACCRAHDSCTGGIPAKESLHGLLNTGLFTRSPCTCDEDFYRCLKEAHSPIATSIGTTYFDLLRPQCIRNDYPVINCKIYGGKLIDDKCIEHNYNYTLPKKWQWFDTPYFIN